MSRILLFAALVPLALAGPCKPSDVSITQDGVYTDVASTFLQLSSGLREDKVAVFSAEFRLFCKGELIKDEALTASVVYRSGSEAYTPKAGLKEVGVMSNSTGSYQVSFALPEDQMPSGEYKAVVSFAGEKEAVAAISMFHSVPMITGGHMEILATVVLLLQAYYALTQIKPSA
mmetsp:Transcript_39313/g.94800  ORF Transcript_39313/g.94800 Transcript_39313/m.94800 type:complete len:174 (+) Transcript_39313:2-523(+)